MNTPTISNSTRAYVQYFFVQQKSKYTGSCDLNHTIFFTKKHMILMANIGTLVWCIQGYRNMHSKNTTTNLTHINPTNSVID